MKNIAPDIVRQRLIIEGFYKMEVGKREITDFFAGICSHLSLKMYGDPIIFSPSGMGKEENQGFDAFVPLVDSGISLYVWSKQKFVSLIIYTCKGFDSKEAVKFTANFFGLHKIVNQDF